MKYTEKDLFLLVQMGNHDYEKVRYYLCGVADPRTGATLGGLIYGYVGGGEHQDWLVLNGEPMEDTGEFEFDDKLIELDQAMGEGFTSLCQDFIFDNLHHNAEENLFELPNNNSIKVFISESTKEEDIIPVDYGNTYWNVKQNKG